MKHIVLILAALLAVGCSQDSTAKKEPTQSEVKGRKVANLGDYSLAEPIVYKNVAVIPVVSTKVPDQDVDYASLEEARKNGWVEIIEQPGEEEVNSLKVRNLGPKPILLLAGQLLIGGKQDRIVGKDTVVPVGKTVDIPVYCVEHGRWEGSSSKFEYRNMQVPQKVKDAAMFGRQEQVWDQVGEYNERAGVSAPTSTVNGGLSSSKVQEGVDAGFAALSKDLSQVENCVGVIYAVNGHIETLELFGAPRLWKMSMEGVLRGMLATAAVEDSSKADVDLDAAADFLTKAMKSQRSLAAASGGGQAARAANDPSLLSISGDGVRGQEMLMAPPTADAKSRDREVLHGSYVNSGGE